MPSIQLCRDLSPDKIMKIATLKHQLSGNKIAKYFAFKIDLFTCFLNWKVKYKSFTHKRLNILRTENNGRSKEYLHSDDMVLQANDRRGRACREKDRKDPEGNEYFLHGEEGGGGVLKLSLRSLKWAADLFKTSIVHIATPPWFIFIISHRRMITYQTNVMELDCFGEKKGFYHTCRPSRAFKLHTPRTDDAPFRVMRLKGRADSGFCFAPTVTFFLKVF